MKKCSTPHVTEEEVKRKFLEAFNSIVEYREELIDNCRLAQQALCDCADLDNGIDELNQEIEVVTELSNKPFSKMPTMQSIRVAGRKGATATWKDTGRLWSEGITSRI